MSADQQKKTSPRVYILAACISLIAGFLAVYVNLGGDGNGRDQTKAAKIKTEGAAKPSSGTETGQSQSANPLQGLNTGEMQNFVLRKTPQDVPSFTFVNDAGEEKTLADWKGKVVLLNLWATWCAPCRKEMPALDALQKKFGGEKFEVVAISIDRGGLEKPRKFLEKINVKALKLYNEPTARLTTKLKALGMPTTLLINREGQEIGRLAGPAEWASEDAIKLIEVAVGSGET